MSGPVSAVACNNPYVCRDDENNNPPPVVLGSGSGFGNGYEPPQPTSNSIGCSLLTFFGLGGTALGLAGTGFGAGFEGVHPKPSTGVMAGGFGTTAVSAIAYYRYCQKPRGPGNPPPSPPANPTGSSHHGNYDGIIGRVSLKEPSCGNVPGDWLIGIGVLAVARFAGPAAARAFLQAAGAGLVFGSSAPEWTPSTGFDASGYPVNAL